MTAMMNFRVVKAPVARPRKPHDTWGGIVKQAWSLPADEAVEIPASFAGPDKSFRAAIHNAAGRLDLLVNITKCDGFYLVQKREKLDASA